MGRKKRPKLDEQTPDQDESMSLAQTASALPESLLCAPVNQSETQSSFQSGVVPKVTFKDDSSVHNLLEKKDKETSSSGYAMTSHSADLISEDVYVSDGSSDEEEDDTNKESNVEINLTASKMGLMRRGLHSQMFQSKTWVRKDEKEQEISEDNEDMQLSDEEQKEEEEVSNMDPAQRAAFLLAEKQKKLEEAKALKRRLESAENAGRDPCLFSKRTAFDIRMDQIEEKPWDRATGGTADMTDYFNYGLSEEDWLEYAERQLAVRQELTDASRQRRLPDPTIVPVQPKAPSKQQPKVAVVVKKTQDEDANAGPSIGPALLKPDNEDDTESSSEEKKISDTLDVVGGAWGGIPGSKLAKLIEEQEQMKNKDLVVPHSTYRNNVGGTVPDGHRNQDGHGPPPFRGGPPPIQGHGGHPGNFPPPMHFQQQDFPPGYNERAPPPPQFPPHHGPPGNFGGRGYHGGDRFGGRGDFGRGGGRFNGGRGRGFHPGRGDRRRY
jgi:hypothetical protein